MAENDVAKKERIRRWLKAILTEGTAEPLPARERALAGNLLAIFGDDRKGVGLRADGLPDIDWITIPASEFWMGSDEYDDEKPRHRVTFREPFQISRYPITNAQYEAFVNDKGYLTESYWTKEGWAWRCEKNVTSPAYWNDDDVFRLSNHPVIGVSWYEAMAFCAWLTERFCAVETHGRASLRGGGRYSEERRTAVRLYVGGDIPKKDAWPSVSTWGAIFRRKTHGRASLQCRLPTEAEWEYAARGPGETYRRYPWGDEITPEHANYSDTNIGATSAVGGFPRGKSAFGCDDMIGNVLEWCLDSYIDNYDNASEIGEIMGDLDDIKAKVWRGGAWRLYAIFCRSSLRLRSLPDYRLLSLGFRVVVAAR
ncbi:hypothetical protein U14_03855 [Candidatus Moduliflexus flocculans]|uniref:Sulfatase-modifying factor enzyme-like domain-containing protein n=1 Tax=Candidatus Moduliflexus flocculans TaxID=1499966 RepID=A0A081BQD7_9BACT|nr:hypothetical protein U14_03855 [Candidatus Moduliflexus flocculans]